VTPPLFLLDPLPVGDVVVLTGDEGHHAATVRRVRPGEEVLVGDGRGSVLRCQVRTVGHDSVELAVLARRDQPPATPRLTVVQALPKGDRAELAVELLTEVGVDEIVPWAASRAVTRWDGERGAKARARWQRTAREAAKQSRRPWLPEVAELASTALVVARLRVAGVALVLHEQAGLGIAAVPLDGAGQADGPRPVGWVEKSASPTSSSSPTSSASPISSGVSDVGDVVLVVGPEGGISDEELAGFDAAGALAVHLGELVMRTSTAGAAALAVLNVRLGRWS
jgi:16S rRNA (uracil1498-N3)-methyltransferase